MHKSLTNRTLSGLNWNFIRTNGKTFVSLIVGVILARLLPPQDFGLLGMTIIFTGLADLFATLGMGSSVIRIKKLTDEHIRTATTITVISSILIFLLFWFTAPWIASFYNEDRIIPILRVLSSLFLIKGITTVSYGRITKNIDFKSILVIELTSFTLGYGLMSSVLAILGFGVWSLVYGRIASALLSSIIILWKMTINLKPLIRKKEFRELAGFGSGVSLSHILNYLSNNVDYAIIGKYLSPYFLGLYTRAFHLMSESISKITSGTYNVLFPAFAMVQSEPEKLRRAYLRTVKTVSFFVFPLLASMIVTSEYIIKGLYGEKWGGAITTFQLLAVGGIIRSTLSYSGAIAHATGKVFKEVRQQFFYLVILGTGAYLLVKSGIEGVAIAVVIALTWKFVVQSRLAIQIIESSWKEFLKAFTPGIVNLVSMVILNLFIVFVMENIFTYNTFEVKLLITAALNIPAFLGIIIFLPASLKDDTFEWLLEKYKKYVPSGFLKVYFAFNGQK